MLIWEYHSVEVVEELIKLAGDVNKPTKKGRTPVMMSYQDRNKPDVLKLLIKYGADVNAQDKNGYTALMQVLKLNNTSEKKAFIKTLIDNGADLTKLKNIQGKNAFFGCFSI